MTDDEIATRIAELMGWKKKGIWWSEAIETGVEHPMGIKEAVIEPTFTIEDWSHLTWLNAGVVIEWMESRNRMLDTKVFNQRRYVAFGLSRPYVSEKEDRNLTPRSIFLAALETLNTEGDAERTLHLWKFNPQRIGWWRAYCDSSIERENALDVKKWPTPENPLICQDCVKRS